jgi:hypothetical protein
LDYEESWCDPPENLGLYTTATIISFAGAGPADAEAASEMGMPMRLGSARRWKCGYKSKIFIDYVTNIYYILPSSLMEGRLRRRS